MSVAACILGCNLAAYAANIYGDLDRSTQQVARAAVQAALENRVRGQAQHWRVPGVARGSVVPRRTWRSRSGHWCREFEEIVQLVNGRRSVAIDVRCRASDGRWRTRGR
jgi:surface antigen